MPPRQINSWLQPVFIVVLTAALGGMTVFALSIREGLVQDMQRCNVRVDAANNKTLMILQELAAVSARQQLVMTDLANIKMELASHREIERKK